MYDIIQKMEKRHDGQRKWLKENHPEVFEEQKHIEEGTPERAYWHHGYMMALRDTLKLLQSPQKKTCSVCGNPFDAKSGAFFGEVEGTEYWECPKCEGEK